MAVTNITIYQANSTSACNLLSVHNPIVFLIDVSYTSTAPAILNVGIYNDTPTLLDTLTAIPYSDTTGVRRFAFIADDILRGYMGSIDDFKSQEKVISYVDGITKVFTLKFYIGAVEADVTFTAIHAARQYGETPLLTEIYNNVDTTYYAAAGKPVYVYFYNNNSNNIITVGTGDFILDNALDYDDVAFLDSDNQYFTTL